MQTLPRRVPLQDHTHPPATLGDQIMPVRIPTAPIQTAQDPAVLGPETTTLRLGLPKGRMQEGVLRLLGDAGISVSMPSRGYRPSLSLPNVEAKLLKPQSIIEMLDAGSRDLGFAGADWVVELSARVVEVFDTGMDLVRVVAAAPRSLLNADGTLPNRPLVIASELERLSKRWIATRDRDDRFVRSYGATEVFPPEDADCIIDLVSSGATLEANNLQVVDELMRSSTRLYASEAAWADPAKRLAIEDFATLLRSVLDARLRVMVELNVNQSALDAVVRELPCMRQPTISPLHGGAGYAVKAAVAREIVPRLIPQLKALGGTDIVITNIAQVVP